MTNRLKLQRNKFSPKRVLLTLLSISVLGTILLVFTKAATPGPNLTITPSSGSFVEGSNFTVAVKEDSQAQAVFSVGMRLSYDATKLDVVSVSNTGGAFPNCADLSGSAGTVKISCYILPTASPGSVTGLQQVANVTFKAKVGGSVNTTVAFIGPPTADYGIFLKSDASNIWNGDTTSTAGTYTLTTASTGGGGGGGGGGGTTPPPATTPPKTTTSSTPKTVATTSPTTTTPTTTTPTTETQTQSQTQADPSATYRVVIFVTDAKGKSVPGATVTVDSQKSSSDALGMATFDNVKTGSHKVKISSSAGSASQNISVPNSTSSGVGDQQFQVKVKKMFNIPLYFAILILITGIIFAYMHFIKPKMDQKKARQAAAPRPQPLGEDAINKTKELGAFVPDVAIPNSKKPTSSPNIVSPKTLSDPNTPASEPNTIKPTTSLSAIAGNDKTIAEIESSLPPKPTSVSNIIKPGS